MIGITTMGKHTNSASTGTGNLEVRFSTRYQDRDFMVGTSEECKLDLLSGRLITLINTHAHNVLALEDLQDEIHDDGETAKADGNVAYMMRYITAFDHLKVLIHNHYLPFQPFNPKVNNNDRDKSAA